MSKIEYNSYYNAHFPEFNIDKRVVLIYYRCINIRKETDTDTNILRWPMPILIPTDTDIESWFDNAGFQNL